MPSTERRVVELVLKATGDEELKRITREMQEVKGAAQASQRELEGLNKAFMGVSAAAAGAWVGGKIVDGIRAVISTVSDAIVEMNELAEAGEAAGSGLSAVAVGGAVELSKAVAELSAEISNAKNEFVGGLAPALTVIVKELSSATGGMDGFFDAGKAVADMLVNQVAQFNRAIATLGAYSDAVSFTVQAITSASRVLAAELAGNRDLAVKWMQSTAAALKAAKLYAANAEQIGQAAFNQTQGEYQQAQAAARRTGYGTATGAGGGKGGGGGASKQRAAEIREVSAATKLWADTQALLNLQLVEGANAFQKADQERQKAIESLPGASNDNWERGFEEQQAALKQLQEDWQGVGDAAGQAAYDIITGADSIKQAVKRMVASIVADMVRMAAQKLLMKLLGIDDFGNVGSSIATKLFSASGNAFGSGGVITAPTMHGISGGGIGIAGEAGPEAIMPLARNSSGQLGIAAPALSVTVINGVNNARVGVRQTDQGLQIDVIERQLADRVRRGGTALPGAIENTYRSGRQASAY